MHPDNPAPNGFYSFNPMKLYTSGYILDALPEGRAFEIHWDDFALWTDRARD